MVPVDGRWEPELIENLHSHLVCLVNADVPLLPGSQRITLSAISLLKRLFDISSWLAGH